MKVSIVVPVYNCEEYLVDCLSSILKQTYQNWECIIWDDGSTDGSLQIAKNYCAVDKRFKFGTFKENRGLSAVLNRAYALSTGDYLCQVDADDILLPLALHTTVYFLNHNPEVGMVYTNKLIINENNTTFREHIGNKEHYSRIKLFFSFPLVTHFRMMRRDVFKQIGGYKESLYFAEDDDFAIRVAWGINITGKRVKPFIIKKLNSICYVYRLRKGSMTNTQTDKTIMENNREELKKYVFWSPCKFWRVKALTELIRWKIYQMERGE